MLSTVVADADTSLPFLSSAFLDAEYGCNFASILIVYSNAHLAVKRDSMSEAELDEDVFSSVPEPVPTASRNSLILAAYA
jgi:hypothetical protein